MGNGIRWRSIQFKEPPIEKPILNLHIGVKGVKQGAVRIDNVEFAAVLPEKPAKKK